MPPAAGEPASGPRTVTVRRERPADRAAVEALHRVAFPTAAEARLVRELRDDEGFLPHLSLVAVDGGDVVGHVIGTRGRLGSPAYYRRFGFVPSAELGVDPPDPAWAAHFQARALAHPAPRGTFRYAEPFDRL